MNSADRVIIRPLNQRLNFLLYIYYSNYMSGINTHYKPAVLLTYFSQNVSLGCLLDLLVVLITGSLHPAWAGGPERVTEEEQRRAQSTGSDQLGCVPKPLPYLSAVQAVGFKLRSNHFLSCGSDPVQAEVFSTWLG